MMHYGPDWPPREPPAAARRRLDVPMLRRTPLAVRAGILAMLVALFVLATLHGGYLRAVPFPMPATPPTTYATTTVGPPLAAHGHPSHRTPR